MPLPAPGMVPSCLRERAVVASLETGELVVKHSFTLRVVNLLLASLVVSPVAFATLLLTAQIAA